MRKGLKGRGKLSFGEAWILCEFGNCGDFLLGLGGRKPFVLSILMPLKDMFLRFNIAAASVDRPEPSMVLMAAVSGVLDNSKFKNPCTEIHHEISANSTLMKIDF